MFEVGSEWASAYPDAHVGVLALGEVQNPEHHGELELKKQQLEHDLRVRYADENRESLRAMPVLAAYDAYYRSFRKTYHVQHQLESVALKGKPIPSVAALVEAMFMAELKNLLLTAGHDLDAVEPPLRIGVATGDESYVRMSGDEQVLKADDMFIADQVGIVSSILYGPDRRARVQPDTQRVIFTVYAPPGVRPEAVQQHLEDIRDNVKLIAPGSSVLMLDVLSAK